MNIKIDINKIITTIIITLGVYLVSTVYKLDKEVTLINYQMEQTNIVLQDIYDTMGKNKYEQEISKTSR